MLSGKVRFVCMEGKVDVFGFGRWEIFWDLGSGRGKEWVFEI